MINTISCNNLVDIMLTQQHYNEILIIDSRSILEHNDNHIKGSLHVSCSKMVKRRLQSGQISIIDLLDTSECDWLGCKTVVAYDQNTIDFNSVDDTHFFFVLVEKLFDCFHHVAVLQGGFTEFSYKYPKLCESKRKSGCALLSISTPCASTRGNCPPTKVLPFLYLGSEEDAQSEDILRTCRVKYVLNASQTAADTPHCASAHYLRIPVRDSSSENIVAWFQTAFDFIDKVKESDDHILLHCVGGVSRSATIAIGYVMRYLSLSLDNAYRYVKEKRPTISPNLNFMGQLVEYERELLKDTQLICTPFNELKLDAIKSTSYDFTKDTISRNEYDLTLGGAFPSPSSDDVFPSPSSDSIPSPSSMSASECSNELSSFTLERPFNLSLNFGASNSMKRNFSLQLPTSSGKET